MNSFFSILFELISYVATLSSICFLLKRLMARPVATLSIAAQEKHEKEEKVFADN